MKKSILSLIILSVIAFSQNVNSTVSGQTIKSKSVQKVLKMPSDGMANEKLVFGTLNYQGLTYKTVLINGKEWMAENLAYLPEVNSSSTTGSYTEPIYYIYDYYGNDMVEAKRLTNYATFGVLYNWHAAKAACPPGWHLPSEVEWTELENFLIANGYNFDNTTSGNKIAKSLAAKSKWNSHSRAGVIGNDLSLNNKTGFSALPGGYRHNSGTFKDIGNMGSWWSSTEGSAGYSIRCYLIFESVKIYRNIEYKDTGLSVRCIKN